MLKKDEINLNEEKYFISFETTDTNKKFDYKIIKKNGLINYLILF
jgi:hypothetical protein